MKNTFSKQKNCGFTLVEVMFACAIISVSLFALMTAASKGIELSNLSLRQTQASLLLEEGAEAVKSIRDSGWTSISGLTLDTNYYLSYNTGTNLWSLSQTPNTIDSIFTRTIVVSSVARNVNDDIVTSGGTLDVGTKKVTVTVTWNATSGTASKTLVFYIADIFT
jgi:prepilin-type N-terminal cleavage/methylation domain-containing protein